MRMETAKIGIKKITSSVNQQTCLLTRKGLRIYFEFAFLNDKKIF